MLSRNATISTSWVAQMDQMRPVRVARENDLDDALDLVQVIVLASKQIIASSDAAPDRQLWRVVSLGDTRIHRLPKHGRKAQGPEKRRFPRHVRAGEQHTVRRSQIDGAWDSVWKQWMSKGPES